MYQIKYIIVNDSAAKGSACESRHRFIPHLGHCVVSDASCLSASSFAPWESSSKLGLSSRLGVGSKFKVSGSKERAALISELCRLRRHWPEAPILGMSELDTSSSHAPVRVSAAMNALRREMSDLP